MLIASGFGAPAGYILKARAQIGWNIPVVGDSSFSANPLPSMASAGGTAGRQRAGRHSAIYKPLSQQSPAFQTLYNAVMPESGTFEVPFVLYECGWDAIMVAQAAATQAESFTHTALTQALESLKAQQPAASCSGPTVQRHASTRHRRISVRQRSPAPTPRTASPSRSGRQLRRRDSSR